MDPTVGHVIGGRLYLRLSPNTSSTALTQIPDGTNLVVCNVTGYNEWFKTEYNGYNGYVMARYVAINKDGGTCLVTTASGSLNIRQTPSRTGTLLYRADRNSTLRLIDSTSVSGWYRVSSLNGTGWADASYLTITALPSASSILYDTSGMTNAAAPLGYNDSYETILQTIPAGTTLSLLTATHRSSGTWYKTAYGGSLGFIIETFIS